MDAKHAVSGAPHLPGLSAPSIADRLSSIAYSAAPAIAKPSPLLAKVLVLLALLFAFTTHAAVRFDVFIGYDGMVPEASWFPVVCEIANDGPSFNGVVEISPGQFNQGQDRQMPLELPTGTTKRFVIPMFASSRASAYAAWDARLLDDRGRLRADNLAIRARRQLNWRIPLMATVARTTLTLPSLSQSGDRVLDWQPGLSRLTPNLFPDNAIALEGLNTIYLNSEKALELKVNQVNALLSWLYQGGHLVVAVEQVLDVQANEWLKKLLPCELSGLSTKAQHPEIMEWLRSNRMQDGTDYPFYSSSGFLSTSTPSRVPSRQRPPAEPLSNPYAGLPTESTFESASMQVAGATLRDGTVLIGTPDSPMTVIARRGRGQITVLLFSPEFEPCISWKNRPWFLGKILGVPPEVYTLKTINNYGGWSIDSVLGSMIDTKQVRKLPVGWLLLLLVGYLLVIGPLDQYWLKKINRQMLTWITFPAYVAGFSALIYLIGYKLRAGETEWNELHVVDVIAVGDKADLRGRTFAAVYSPSNARYKLASDQPTATLRGEYQRGQESSKATIVQQGNSFNAEIAVPVWTSQLYVGDWLRRDDPPLTFSITTNAQDCVLRINNHLDKPIKEARLVIDNRIQVIQGGIPARQISEHKLYRSSGIPLTSFVQSQGNEFQSIAIQRQQAFGGNRRDYNLTNGVIAASFIGQYNAQISGGPQSQFNYNNTFITPPGFDLSRVVEHGDAVLLAWVPDFTLTKPLNKFSPRRTHRDTLLRVSAEVKPLKLEL